MNRYVRPILFAFEPDDVFVYAMASFGSAGAVTLNTSNSKGICNWALVSRTSVATTTNTSTSVTGVVNMYGLYNGMSVTGTGIPASTVISAVNPGAGTLTLSQAATASGSPTLTFSGGQYNITFGTKYTPFKVLDSYVRLLQLTHNWDESVNEKAVSAATPSSPSAPGMFLVENQINVSNTSFVVTGSQTSASAAVTAVSNTANLVPGMLVSGSGIPAATSILAVGATTLTLSANATSTIANNPLTIVPINPASITIQLGTYSAGTFVAANPASGEVLRLAIELTRSTAV